MCTKRSEVPGSRFGQILKYLVSCQNTILKTLLYKLCYYFLSIHRPHKCQFWTPNSPKLTKSIFIFADPATSAPIIPKTLTNRACQAGKYPRLIRTKIFWDLFIGPLLIKNKIINNNIIVLISNHKKFKIKKYTSYLPS